MVLGIDGMKMESCLKNINLKKTCFQSVHGSK